MAALWEKVRVSLGVVRHMEGGESRHMYSARAAYNFPGFKQGEVLNIDTRNTVSKIQTGNNALWLLVAAYCAAVAATQIILAKPADTTARKVACVVVGSFSLMLPFILIALSNRQLLFRILCRSFMPWVKLYMCAVETYSLCSLCSWNWRAFATPLLFTSQLNIFVADALFYRNRKHMLALLMLFILWRIVLILGVRLEFYGELDYSTFNFLGFNFYNSGSFVSKSLSLLLFQIGQLVFYIRYKHRLYSIRTTYTVLENKVWNNHERRKRVDRKNSKQEDVEEMRRQLEEVSNPLRSNTRSETRSTL